VCCEITVFVPVDARWRFVISALPPERGCRGSGCDPVIEYNHPDALSSLPTRLGTA
jgi:hypothetical protein